MSGAGTKSEQVSDDLRLPDTSMTADFQVVVGILRDAYPEMDAEEAVSKVPEVTRHPKVSR